MEPVLPQPEPEPPVRPRPPMPPPMFKHSAGNPDTGLPRPPATVPLPAAQPKPPAVRRPPPTPPPTRASAFGAPATVASLRRLTGDGSSSDDSPPRRVPGTELSLAVREPGEIKRPPPLPPGRPPSILPPCHFKVGRNKSDPVWRAGFAASQEPKQQFSLQYFMNCGSTQRHTFVCPSSNQKVQFEAVLVNPTPGQVIDPHHRVPLVVWYAGLGFNGGFKGLTPEMLRPLACSPFVMIAPLRESSSWWFIDNDGTIGWLAGDFMPSRVRLHCTMINYIASSPGMDPDAISILGFSAGGYAATEILGCGSVKIHNLIIGGAHGHGQPDWMYGLSPKRRRALEANGLTPEKTEEKWLAYLTRLRTHKGVSGTIHISHHKKDSSSPIAYARLIYVAIDERQTELNLPKATFDDDVPLVGAGGCHEYLRSTFVSPSIVNRLCSKVLPV